THRSETYTFTYTTLFRSLEVVILNLIWGKLTYHWLKSLNLIYQFKVKLVIYRLMSHRQYFSNSKLIPKKLVQLIFLLMPLFTETMITIKLKAMLVRKIQLI